jgi:hypothetical protein
MLIEILKAYRQHGGRLRDDTGEETYAEATKIQQEHVEKAVVDKTIGWADVWRLVFMRLMSSSNKKQVMANIRMARRFLREWEQSIEKEVGMTADQMIGEDEENTP